MLNSRQITVCILALTDNQHTDIEPKELRDLLLQDETKKSYDIKAKNKIYGSSPDDWSPFENKKPIFNYLSEEGFDVTSLSYYLIQKKNIQELDVLISQIDFYIIDASFPSLDKSFPGFLDRLDVAIFNGVTKKEKAFCLISPLRIPTDIRIRLEELCEKKLRSSKEVYTNGYDYAEWGIQTLDKFLIFLRRLKGRIEEGKTKPRQIRISELVQIIGALGAKDLQMDQTPKLIDRTA
jgi:hypothetical protein